MYQDGYMPMRNSRKIVRPATMRDVAKLAGVSQPTVSRVLNRKDTTIAISDETIEKVMAAVEQLSYTPNLMARGLRTQQTQMISVMIADISNSFYHPIARSIHDVAREHNFDVLIANSDHLYENEKHFCEAVIRRPVDGVIMVPIHLTDDDFTEFLTQNIPLVVLGHHVTHPNVDVVMADDEKAIYDATKWLIEEKGHTKIGYLGVPDYYPPGPRRFRGFMRALADAGLTVKSEHIIESDFTLEGGRVAAQQLLQCEELPTVLVVLNDLMAIGVMLRLQDAGLRVPEDIAVLGFDDIPETTIVRPALTTIAQDPRDLGQKLAHALFERIENPDLPRRLFESPCRLVERKSV